MRPGWQTTLSCLRRETAGQNLVIVSKDEDVFGGSSQFSWWRLAEFRPGGPAVGTNALTGKDEDFFFRASQDRGTVQLVWVRLGNCRNRQLLAAFEKVLPSLLAELQQGARIVEVC